MFDSLPSVLFRRFALSVWLFVAAACDGDVTDSTCPAPLHPYADCLGDCAAGFQIESDEDGCSTCECEPVPR